MSLLNDKAKARQKTLSHYLIKIVRLGGYLARASDPPPGNTVMWRRLSRLTDIAMGAMVREEFVGYGKHTFEGPSTKISPCALGPCAIWTRRYPIPGSPACSGRAPPEGPCAIRRLPCPPPASSRALFKSLSINSFWWSCASPACGSG
jgi:hypothetical protein